MTGWCDARHVTCVCRHGLAELGWDPCQQKYIKRGLATAKYHHSAQYHRNGSHRFLKNILRIAENYYNFISALVQDVLKRKVLLQWFYKNGWIKEYQNYGGKWKYFCKSKIQVKSFVYVFFHYSDSSLKTGDVRSHLHH